MESIIDKIDMRKLFNKEIKIPQNITLKLVKALLDPEPETTRESLMEILIKQELKVLNGKKMVRN